MARRNDEFDEDGGFQKIRPNKNLKSGGTSGGGKNKTSRRKDKWQQEPKKDKWR